MRFLEGIFLWATIFFYVASFSIFLSGVVFKKEKQVSIAWKGFIAAFVFHTTTIIVRWIESGHPPVLWTYEHALLSSWFVALIFIASARWASPIKAVGAMISAVILMVLGYGIMSKETGIEPLPPPYQSNWLWVHVGFAWIAYSAFAFAAVIAFLYIIRQAALSIKGKVVLKWLPSPEVLDDLIFRVIFFGFVGLTVEMGAGAI